MAQPFVIKPMLDRTLWQKLLARESPDNIVVDVNNMLAKASRVLDFTESQLSSLCLKHGMDIRKSCRQGLLEIYSLFLHHCLTDHDISDVQDLELAHLRGLFLISDEDHNSLSKPIAKTLFTEALHDRAKDGSMSEQDHAYLADLSVYFGLTDDEVASLKRETFGAIIHARFADIMRDGELSPDEEKDLKKIAASFRIQLSFDEASRMEMERSRTMWKIRNEPLPVIDSHITLSRGEVCHCKLHAEWHETRKVRVGTAYSGPTMRVKIATGVYWRLGTLGHAPISQDSLVKIDSGDLYLTSKRLILIGAQHTKTIQLGKILDIKSYSDGIEVSKGSGKNPVLLFDGDVLIFSAMLARAIQS